MKTTHAFGDSFSDTIAVLSWACRCVSVVGTAVNADRGRLSKR